MSEKRIKLDIVAGMSGNLLGKIKQATQNFDNLAAHGKRSMKILSLSVGGLGQQLDRLGNRYTAILTGAAGIGTAKMVMELETRLVRLGITANKSAEEIAALKKEIFAAATAADIRINPEGIISAIEEIAEKTGDLKFARENIRNIGLAIQATGADGQAIGGIMSEFQKMGIVKPKEVLEALDILTVQGKEGAFTLQNLAALGPRVVTSYTSMGRGGVQAIREMGAALQVIRQGTGSSEMAATAFEAVIRTLGNKKKVAELKKLSGINVFDPEALKKGKEVLRPINEIMTEIIKKSGGKKTMLSQVFDEEAIRAFNSAASEYQRTGHLESLEKFMKIQADGSTIMKDSARAAKTASASIDYLSTAWKKFADEQTAGPIQKLADKANAMKPGTLETVMKVGTGGFLGIGGMVAARKAMGLFRYGKGVINLLRAGAGAAGAAEAVGGAGGLAATLGTGVLAAGAGTVGLTVGAGAALGGGIGYAVNKQLLDGTAFGNAIGAGLNRIAAALGNKESKLVIELNTKDGTTAKVKTLNSRGMDVNVHTGIMQMGP